MKKIAIVGATSAIAEATIREFCPEGSAFVLCGRDRAKCERVKADALARGACSVSVIDFDAARAGDSAGLFNKILALMSDIDIVFICFGELPSQEECETSDPTLTSNFQINLVSQIQIASSAASYFSERKIGCLAIVTSVAGVRGRQSNYFYGSAKGALSIFLQGLQHRFSGSAVRVVDLIPGLVDTPMTEDMEKGGILWSRPSDISPRVKSLLEHGDGRYYLPMYWGFIMAVIKVIPSFIFGKIRI